MCGQRVVSYSDRIGGFIRGRDRRGLSLSPCSQTKERPDEHTVRRWLPPSQEERSHQNLTTQTSNLQTGEK